MNTRRKIYLRPLTEVETMYNDTQELLLNLDLYGHLLPLDFIRNMLQIIREYNYLHRTRYRRTKIKKRCRFNHK